jgi:hypothetical protein
VDGSVAVDFETSLSAVERTEKEVADTGSSRVRTKTLAGIPTYSEAETFGGEVERSRRCS